MNGPDDTTKLDALTQQITDLRVAVADVAGDVKAVLGRLKDHDRTSQDHETRIRTLEAQIANRDHDHETRLRHLERALWMSAGAAAAAGGGIGATLSAIFNIGH